MPVRYFDAIAHSQDVISEESMSSGNGNESELANAAEGYRLATYGDSENIMNQLQNSSNQISQGSNRKQHERLDIHYRTGTEGISASSRKRQIMKANLRSEVARKHANSPEIMSGQRGRIMAPSLQHSFAKN